MQAAPVSLLKNFHLLLPLPLNLPRETGGR